jgi:hypothetical protein
LSVPPPPASEARDTEPPTLATPTLSGRADPLSREVRAVVAEQWLAQVQATSSAEIAALGAQTRQDSASATAPAPTGDATLAPDLLALVLPDNALAALQAGYDLPAALTQGSELLPLTGDGLGLLRADLAEESGRLQSAIDPIEASGLALTVGLVWWTVRLGGVAGSLLVSVPTWQLFDPLPVLTRPPTARRPTRQTDGPGDLTRPDLQNEEASAAEVLGRDQSAAVEEAAAADDSLDTTTTTASKGVRR